MNFLHDNVDKIYRKYLVPTLGSALAMSIYSFVDTIAVGQYAGPNGSAAIAVINPVYAIMIVIAFLCSTGGSVCYGNAIGKKQRKKADSYFTVSLFLCIALTCTAWLLFSLYFEKIIRFFGAGETVMPYASAYGKWIIRFFPVIVMPDYLASFLRMDKDPQRAMLAVITGGMLNIFLDWFLVFPMNLGMEGAALATVIGTSLQCVIMLSHFFSRKNHLHPVIPEKIMITGKEILLIGASSSLLDLGNVFLSILMNRQMLAYGGADALGIYGVINTIAMLVQALFSGVGQTIQPGISVNHGAENQERVHHFLVLGQHTAVLMGIIFTAAGELFPNTIIRLFMNATSEVLQAAPAIMRLYFLCFPFMGYGVVSAYYLQSVLQQKFSSAIALLRSIVLPAFFLLVLPLFLKETGVCIALPLSDCIAAVTAHHFIAITDQ